MSCFLGSFLVGVAFVSWRMMFWGASLNHSNWGYPFSKCLGCTSYSIKIIHGRPDFIYLWMFFGRIINPTPQKKMMHWPPRGSSTCTFEDHGKTPTLGETTRLPLGRLCADTWIFDWSHLLECLSLVGTLEIWKKKQIWREHRGECAKHSFEYSIV